MNESLLQLIESANTQLLDSALSPVQIIASLCITLMISIFIYFVYRMTYSGALYSKNFNITLIMTALIVNAIMIGINGSLVLSLGMVGALSVIRFRTAVKDPKDTAFLFWAVAIGVINGVTYYALSIIATLFIAAVLACSRFAKGGSENYILIMHLSENRAKELKSLLSRAFKKFSIRTESHGKGQIEKIIEVSSPKCEIDKFISQLQAQDYVQNCTLLTQDGELSE